MSGQLATIAPTPPPSVLWLGSCEPARGLLQIAQRITGSSQKELFAEWEQESFPNSPRYNTQNNILHYLAKSALRAGNISEKLIDLMNIRENKPLKEGAVNYVWYAIWGWTITYEEHLPPCQFNIAFPLSQERYVVCRQAINYFAEQLTTAILESCKIPALSLNDPTEPYQNFGAYLIAAESSITPKKSQHESSWAIRQLWKEQFQRRFCQITASTSWKETLCTEKLMKNIRPQDQNLQSWTSSIWPTTYWAKDVYTDQTKREILFELDRRKSILNTFSTQSAHTSSHIIPMLDAEAKLLYQQVQQNKLIERVVDYKRQIKEVWNRYQAEPNADLWKRCSDLARKIQYFLNQEGLASTYPELMELSQKCLRSSPQSNSEL